MSPEAREIVTRPEPAIAAPARIPAGSAAVGDGTDNPPHRVKIAIKDLDFFMALRKHLTESRLIFPKSR